MSLSSSRGCSVSFSGLILLTVGAGLLLRAPAGGQQATPHQPAAGQPASPRDAGLLAILDEHVEFLHRTDPLAASRRGDERYNDQLSDDSPAAIAANLREITDRLARLEALDRAHFTEADHTDADLLAYDLRLDLEGARFHPEHTPVTTMDGPQIGLPQIGDRLPFRTPKHYTDYASRLEAIASVIDTAIVQMRAGLKDGRVPPRITMSAAIAQCREHGSPDIQQNPTESPFYKPFIGAGPEDTSAARARAAIADSIAPAYRRLADFLEREYIPRCRDTVGASEGVDGRALYDYAIKRHTTLDLTADQVHETGLSEVARIRREMDEVIDRSDFPRKTELKGDDRFAAFVQFLRADPRFYYTDEQDLLKGYEVICKRIDPELPRLFGTLPRNTYGIRPLPKFAAASSPTAYYYAGSMKGGLAGYFMANTYRLDQRPKYGMISLALHEAVPGHHLQVALAQELEGVHEYRTWVWFTAFGEGWALYAERLGLEMGEGPARRGLFSDPYDDFGRLNFEMWRACRLVIDTGIHAKGWTRQQAIDYLLANTALALYDIEREVDRYIGSPGQATGYKIGEIKIRELRARAQAALGDRFDVHSFHDAVLGSGPIPLPVLERRIDRWIDSQPVK
jgi:uncharacterized protein (DUF885 family)